MTSAELTLIPRISEKTFGQSQGNIYVFNVPMTVNRQQIADAVAEQYKVEVVSVKVLIAKGKTVRTVRKRSGAMASKRRDTKKAYVRLADGNSIKIFDEEEKK